MGLLGDLDRREGTKDSRPPLFGRLVSGESVVDSRIICCVSAEQRRSSVITGPGEQQESVWVARELHAMPIIWWTAEEAAVD